LEEEDPGEVTRCEGIGSIKEFSRDTRAEKTRANPNVTKRKYWESVK
jgi:hypothetical protein